MLQKKGYALKMQKIHGIIKIYVIMCTNMIRDGQAADDSIIRRIRVACWITKATDTHSEYVIGYLLLFHG
jgi:hypothetical protein